MGMNNLLARIQDQMGKPLTEAKKVYTVTVQRSSWREHTFDIEASSESEARRKAVRKAGDHNFGRDNEKGADYEVVGLR